MQDAGYCECGCGERTSSPTTRYRSGHNRRRTVEDYEIDPITGCWEWLRARHPDGYGAAWDGKRVRRAHRVMYERLVGPIPTGLVLDHLCRNPGCVNPAHLEPVTDAVNLRRGQRTKLSVADVHALRQLQQQVICSTRELARIVAPIYDASPATIRQAIYGIKWKDPKERRTS